MANDIWYQGGTLQPVTGNGTSLATLIGLPLSKKTSGLYNEVVQTAAAAMQWGVLVDYDADDTDEGLMLVGPAITNLTLAATLAAGAQFQWDSAGKATTLSTGKPAGIVLVAGGANDIRKCVIYPPSADTIA